MRFPFKRTIDNKLREIALRKDLAKNSFELSNQRFELLFTEYADYMKYYLPISIKGKTVLDIGAGAGETAFFFLKNGAQRIIGIEPNEEEFRYLFFNSLRSQRISCYQKYFDLEILKMFEYDLLKMDIEGFEEILLEDLSLLKRPSVIEIHGLPLIEKFRDAGFRIVDQTKKKQMCLSYGYWMC